jgi:hypothetical protein
MKLQRSFVLIASLLALSLALAGCGNKTAQNGTGSAASDSLLSSTPVEQPQGQLQPESQGMPADQGQQTAPAPAPQTQSSKPAPRPTSSTSHPKPAAAAPSATVAGGTSLGITVGTALTSETATPGGAWSGSLKENLIVGNTVVFPAGSAVNGVVAASKPAAKGDRAFLLLQVTSIAGHDISATSDSMIAGSTTKRNVGAVVGGAAAGALIGKAMGGSGKSAVIGGILGGAAATGAVAASKGFQVEVKEGKELVFHVDHDSKVKL